MAGSAQARIAIAAKAIRADHAGARVRGDDPGERAGMNRERNNGDLDTESRRRNRTRLPEQAVRQTD
jgi:hypothetical protein